MNTITREEALKARIEVISSEGCLHVIDHETSETLKSFLETKNVQAANFRKGYIAALMNDSENGTASEVRLKRIVSLLTELRSHWMKECNEKTYGSPQWMGKHQGVYALDEAIKTVKAGKLKRYKDEGITIP